MAYAIPPDTPIIFAHEWQADDYTARQYPGPKPGSPLSWHYVFLPLPEGEKARSRTPVVPYFQWRAGVMDVLLHLRSYAALVADAVA